MRTRSIAFWFNAALLALLILVPLYASLASEPFLMTFMSRVLVFTIAAISLNMILGYGGMVSFGHALYMGLGAYCVGIMASHGINNGWLQVIVMMLACALVGLLTGLISLRTTGIAFIMITLAFAQMFYYLFVSLKPYGGDDGLPLDMRSNFTLFDLSSPTVLYYVALLAVVSSLYVCARTVDARFGMVLRGCRLNERRMKALGFATTRYKLLAYVWSCMLCGMSGVLYANLTGFTSPAYLAWPVSGELIVIVVLGGMGTIFGPLVGALTLLVSEEILKALTDHWMAVLGPLIVLVVLTAKRGLYGYLLDWDKVRLAREALWATRTDEGGKT
jgi:branched-chain amino acid transport system permease protein